MRVAGSDPDSEVRLLALATLADLGDRATIPLMLSALQSHDMARRLHGIRGLANTRAPEIVQPLVARLDDAHGAIRAAAARALADIGDRAALAPIRAAVRRTWRPFLRLRLRDALVRLERQTAK